MTSHTAGHEVVCWFRRRGIEGKLAFAVLPRPLDHPDHAVVSHPNAVLVIPPEPREIERQAVVSVDVLVRDKVVDT